MIMQRIGLLFFMAVISATAFAQVDAISVTVVRSEPVTGLTTINYEFTGINTRTYNLCVEVNFDGTGYVPVPEAHLSGDIPAVSGNGTTFSGTIVWNGAASFPDHYHAQTTVRVTAQPIIMTGEVTDYEGNAYPTVTIDGREWMAKNLRATKYNDGNDIGTDWSGTSGAHAIYPHADIAGLTSDEEVLEAYGALYNWHAVNDSRGLCPTGWSVASNDEWTALVFYVAGPEFLNFFTAANALKSCRQIDSPLGCGCNTSIHPRWDADATHHGFDEFGFSALPGGARWGGAEGSFWDIGKRSHWWTSAGSETTASGRVIFWDQGLVDGYSYDKSHGFGVRCIKNQPVR
jgi:uncharacterized protein (TIGR02145 family)